MHGDQGGFFFFFFPPEDQMKCNSELFGESNCVITVKEVVSVLDSDKAQKTYSQLSMNLQIKF